MTEEYKTSQKIDINSDSATTDPRNQFQRECMSQLKETLSITQNNYKYNCGHDQSQNLEDRIV